MWNEAMLAAFLAPASASSSGLSVSFSVSLSVYVSLPRPRAHSFSHSHSLDPHPSPPTYRSLTFYRIGWSRTSYIEAFGKVLEINANRDHIVPVEHLPTTSSQKFTTQFSSVSLRDFRAANIMQTVFRRWKEAAVSNAPCIDRTMSATKKILAKKEILHDFGAVKHRARLNRWYLIYLKSAALVLVLLTVSVVTDVGHNFIRVATRVSHDYHSQGVVNEQLQKCKISKLPTRQGIGKEDTLPLTVFVCL